MMRDIRSEIVCLRGQIDHDRRWSKEFFRSALAAEVSMLSWKGCGNDFLVVRLAAAVDGDLNTAAYYESSAYEATRRLAQLEKSH